MSHFTSCPGKSEQYIHTWGRQLHYHPHIHYIVPGGALALDEQQWHPSSLGFFLPVKALSKIFRAKFRDRMKAAGFFQLIPPEVWQVDWNVNCQSVGTAEATLHYLAPYVFKVAISDQRIAGIEEGRVTFRYKKSHSQRLRTMTLEAMEFIRRFLQHVLPTGFIKVRYYGVLSPTFSVPIEEVKATVEIASGFTVISPEPNTEAPNRHRCPHCGGTLRYLRSVRLPRPAPLRDTAQQTHAMRPAMLSAALNCGP
ncbi:MAG: IS91 family transposase [Gammaproteobacteria bacterium]